MPTARYNLAIETSSPAGSVSLGAGDELLESGVLPAQQRHAIALMPAVDAMVARHGFQPRDCEAVFVSVGPGSFTGLRIGVTIAKTLARVSGAAIAAVPTLDVIAENVTADHERVAVCLNAKRGQCFTGVYQRTEDGWQRITDPALLTPPQVAEHEPAAVVGDAHVVERLDWPGAIERLGVELAVPRSEVVWRLGRAMLERGETTDPYALSPLYVRLPEAEEIWQKNQATQPRSQQAT